MNAIPLDDDLKAKLGGLDKPVEVKDDRGRVVGTFVPQQKYELLLSWWAYPHPAPEPSSDRPPVPAEVVNQKLLDRMKR